MLPFFRYIPPTQVTHVVLDDVVSRLTTHELSTTTISQYLVIVRKLLKLAVRKGLLKEVPELPSVKITIQPRSILTLAQQGGLDSRWASRRLDDMLQTVDHWPELASSLDISASTRQHLKRVIEQQRDDLMR